MSEFYRVETAEDGRVTIHRARKIVAAGWTLDAGRVADQAVTRDGWRWYPSEAAFRASPEAAGLDAALTRQALVDAGVTIPDPWAPPADGLQWTQPTGIVGAYRAGQKVTYGGSTWTSTFDYNVFQPGVAGWVKEAGSTPQPWVQPSSTNPYKKGDKVLHKGATWESIYDNNTWEPGTAGWVKVA